MSEPALVIDGLTYAYASDAKAVDRASFTAPRGRFTALLGPNGAGKTTLMSLVTRLFQAREGRIAVCGHDLAREPRLALSLMGVVFQRPTVDLDLTVLQNLRYAARLQGLPGATARRRIDWALQQLEIADRARAPVRTLSGGLRRRVELARSLLHEPRLLVLDEPTVGLDIDSRRGIVEHVHALARDHGTAILWTTHLIDEVWPGDRVVVIDRGRVKAEGETPEVLAAAAADDLATAYRQLTGASAGRQKEAA